MPALREHAIHPGGADLERVGLAAHRVGLVEAAGERLGDGRHGVHRHPTDGVVGQVDDHADHAAPARRLDCDVLHDQPRGGGGLVGETAHGVDRGHFASSKGPSARGRLGQSAYSGRGGPMPVVVPAVRRAIIRRVGRAAGREL